MKPRLFILPGPGPDGVLVKSKALTAWQERQRPTAAGVGGWGGWGWWSVRRTSRHAHVNMDTHPCRGGETWGGDLRSLPESQLDGHPRPLGERGGQTRPTGLSSGGWSHCLAQRAKQGCFMQTPPRPPTAARGWKPEQTTQQAPPCYVLAAIPFQAAGIDFTRTRDSKR